MTIAWATAVLAVTQNSGAGAEAAASGQPAGPHEVVAEVKSQLFTALERVPAAARRSDRVLPLLDGLLAPHFDAEYMARLVLGRHWNAATADQRQQFAVAFYQRMLRTYVNAVAGWTAERITLLPLNIDAEALQATVHTDVRNPGAASARVDYRLRQTPGGWKIFDVIVDGVSYARSYRDDIDADVERNGVDAAITRLK